MKLIKRIIYLIVLFLLMLNTSVYAETSATKIDYSLSLESQISVTVTVGSVDKKIKIKNETPSVISSIKDISFTVTGDNSTLSYYANGNLRVYINNKVIKSNIVNNGSSLAISVKSTDIKDTNINFELCFINGNIKKTFGSYFLIKSEQTPVVKMDGIKDSYPFETHSVKISGFIGSQDFEVSSKCIFLKLKKNSLIDADNIHNLIEKDGYCYLYLNDDTFGKSVPFSFSIPIKKVLSGDTSPIEGSIVFYSNDFLSTKGRKYEVSNFSFKVDKPTSELFILEQISRFSTTVSNVTNSIYTKVVGLLFKDKNSSDNKTSKQLNIENCVLKNTLQEMKDLPITTSSTKLSFVVKGTEVSNTYTQLPMFFSILNNEYRKNLITNTNKNRLEILEDFMDTGNINMEEVFNSDSSSKPNTNSSEEVTFERHLSNPADILDNDGSQDSSKLIGAMELVQKQQDLQRAIGLFNDLINKKYNTTLCYRYLSEIDIINKKYSSALDNIRLSLKSYSDTDSMALSKAEIYLTAAYIYYKVGNYPRSFANLDAAKELNVTGLNNFPIAYTTLKKYIK